MTNGVLDIMMLIELPCQREKELVVLGESSSQYYFIWVFGEILREYIFRYD